MKNIIFSSLVGTLIDDEDLNPEEAQIFLKQYLKSENNIFVIIVKRRTLIVDVGEDFYLNLFNTLSLQLNESEKKRLIFYLADRHNEKEGIEDICISNNILKINYFKFNKIYGLLNYLENNKNNYRMMGIGIEVEDLDMLFKIKDLGGISYLINSYNFSAKEKTKEELLMDIISKEIDNLSLKLRKQLHCSAYDFFTNSKYEEFARSINEKIDLYRKYLLTLNKEQLEYIYSIQKITERYCDCKEWDERLNPNKEWNEEELLDPKEQQDKIEKKLILIKDNQIFTKLNTFIS